MMGLLQSLSFSTPLALWALAALPIIWWLLRFTPPRPQSIAFPPIRILLSLNPKEQTPDKTPWWLLVLRLTMAALIIAAVAHPFINRSASLVHGNGPLLVIVDDGWAAAKDWPKRQDALQSILNDARADGRAVTLATTTPELQPQNLASMAAADALDKLRALQPKALNTNRVALLPHLKNANLKATQVIWLSDGFDSGSAAEFSKGLAAQFSTITALTMPTSTPRLGLGRPTIEAGDIAISAFGEVGATSTAQVQANAGNGRVLATAPLSFSGTTAATKLSLPVELRNEIQSISISGENHAGAIQLLDDRWHRKTVAVQASSANEAAQPLLSPMYYVKRALEPFAELHEPTDPADLKATIDSGLSMLVMADIGNIPAELRDTLAPWVEKGGVLLRFAGPHVATGNGELLPVTLREGDRSLGSALSWETPQAIQSISDKSPFSGLAIDKEIAVSRQVLAEPDANLAEKTWVSLADGTPLVTAAHQGKGMIILFHVTANADWSNLPLSGSFAAMLQRIVDIAPAAGSTAAAAQKDETTGPFALRLALTGVGELASPTANYNALSPTEIEVAKPSAQTPPGLYSRGSQERAINLNLSAADFAPLANLPAVVTVETVKPPSTTNYAPALFIAAAMVFMADCLAALLLAGGFKFSGRNAPTAAVILILTALLGAPHLASPARADDQASLQAAVETHLAYVKTGNQEIDQTSAQGLKGLGTIMADRTSAILGAPVALDIESDELVFYPIIYWPVSEGAQQPSDKALARIDAYMKNGGTLFFDLRDAEIDFGGPSANAEALRRILAKLDIPALEPVPADHALTKTFYLLKSWPGRYESGTLWVEASGRDGPAKSDGVSGIIIGANDYAAAWALDERGEPLNAVIPGTPTQREFAFRVGVNVVMYALTGNYKTDQVHVPALLERLGQ